jgi:signal transduction histidine kinase
MDYSQNSFLGFFTEKGRDKLKAEAQEQSFNSGDIIFEDQDPVEYVYLLGGGTVEITKGTGERKVLIAQVQAGDYFGELGVLDQSARSAGARCRGDVQVLAIPSGVLLEVLSEEPVETTFKLFGRILQHLRSTNDRFATEVLRKEKLQIIGQMASGIIHDFKNPITAIQLSAELLGSKHRDETTTKRCQTIIQQSQRMVSMVQELLDFARGNTMISREAVSIKSLLQQFAEMNSELLEQTKIQLDLKPTDTVIPANGAKLLRVLQNVCGNAIEAMSAGGKLEISSQEQGDDLLLLIRDNGPGIPEAIRETLFDPFVTHGKKQGTGLGMAITKNFVEAHHGKIWFETELGKGTTFFIQLPRSVKKGAAA